MTFIIKIATMKKSLLVFVLALFALSACFGSASSVDGKTYVFHDLDIEFENEEMEADSVYLQFADIADDEGFSEAAKLLRQIASVENCHKLLLEQVYKKLKANKLYKSSSETKWKCSNCGFEHSSKQAWSICPLCASPQGFVEITIDTGN